ncbi:MAG: GTP cyclohydrolase II [Pseudomonadota bacterium]
MTFLLSPSERLARMRSDLRIGLPVVIKGDRTVLVAASELVTDKLLAKYRSIGDPYIGITKWRADVLKVAAYDGDLTRLHLPADADGRWVVAMSDPQRDLDVPMKGPFKALRDDDYAAADLGIRLAKQAHLLPSVLAVETDEVSPDLTVADIDLLWSEINKTPKFHSVSNARVPLQVTKDARVHVFRPEDGTEEHYVIEIGQAPRDEPVLARLHSACFTGDVVGSLKCDCGSQLNHALRSMAANGSGVLLYLNQEGRGIGLANKMRAYALQDQGYDTVEANHRLGFEDDERNFKIGADLLKLLGFNAVRLMTNNPNKIERMENCGVKVAERVPLKVGKTAENEGYLSTKAAKSGHML